VDETRIDSNLRVDRKDVADLAGKTAGGPADADDEPKDSTKIDEFRLDDLAGDETRAGTAPKNGADGIDADDSEGSDDEGNATAEKTAASARSPKDKT
jgi:hypothetical protein